MIKQKIISLAAAVALTLGMMAPVAFPTVATAQTKTEASIIINFCKIAHRRFMQGDKGEYLSKGMAGLSTDANRAVVALSCASYGEGYGQARKDLV